MSTLLLQTKLSIPPVRPDLVARAHLIERIDASLFGRLTLVSAPAGCGKTTLLSEWCAVARTRGVSVAWVSLDAGDNAFERFWTYTVAALQTVHSSCGADLLSILRSSSKPTHESLLTLLINDVVTIPGDVVLILDDYQVIEEQDIHQSLAFLLDHMPDHMHLIIASRRQPPLPLHRWRGRGQIIELRADDLRFSYGETETFLRRSAGLDLSPEQVALLETRTEGWAAGVQMAVLSMQKRSDWDSFLKTFRGTHRHVMDYLLAEVLDSQPADIQTFLLHTSVLSRLCASLCDVIRQRNDSQKILEGLERSNLFTVPLDSERHWYRYHHLFADVLRRRLQAVEPDRVPTLHKRAARWCQSHGFLSEAVDYALASQDFEFAADLLEEIVRPLREEGSITLSLSSLAALPHDVLTARPYLCINYAWMLFFTPQRGDAEEWLQRAEEQIEAEPSHAPTHADPHIRTMRGEIAAVRLSINSFSGTIEQSTAYAQRALALLSEDDTTWRQLVHVWLAAVYREHGDAQKAEQWLTIAQEKYGSLYFRATTNWMVTELERGRLRHAFTIFQQAPERYRTGIGAGSLWVNLEGAALIQYEWNNLDAALEHIRVGMDISEKLGDPSGRAYGHLLQARIHHARGDLPAAVTAFQEMLHWAAQISASHGFQPGPAELDMLRTQHWLRSGNLPAVRDWAEQSGLSTEDEADYRRLREHLTFARFLLAQGEPERILPLLERIGQQAESHGRMRDLIEILTLHALALQAAGQMEEAVVKIERALTLGEPEGYIRTFLDEGEPMARLLQRVAQHTGVPDYSTQLLAAFAADDETSKLAQASALPSAALIEPLSERELEVLILLADGMTNREIANALHITVGTVKTHVHNIYGKLQVQNRTAAAARARELNLLPESTASER